MRRIMKKTGSMTGSMFGSINNSSLKYYCMSCETRKSLSSKDQQTNMQEPEAALIPRLSYSS